MDIFRHLPNAVQNVGRNVSEAISQGRVDHTYAELLFDSSLRQHTRLHDEVEAHPEWLDDALVVERLQRSADNLHYNFSVLALSDVYELEHRRARR